MVAEHGAERFSLREAAREVGVSANAAYRHFDDKSALLHALAQEGFARLAAEMERARGAVETPDARLRAIGRVYIDFARDQPQQFWLMFGADGLRSVRGAPADAPSSFRVLATALDELVEDGQLTPAQREGAEVEMWSLVHGYACLMLEGATAWPPADGHAEVVERLLDFALAGLRARSGSG